MAMIEVENLTKRYGEALAIDSLAFTVERGEIVGFLGPNGAGKSTTMRILCGSLGATAGTARINGADVAEDPRAVQAIVGYLPESPPLYVDMTVRAYLAFCARLKRAREPAAAVERVIERVGLAQVAHRLIRHLSKGYRQRVGIAQALVHTPQVLVLDEPTSGLDPAQRVEIRELVRELSRGDVTVVLSTHVLPEVEALCERVIIVSRGRIVAQSRIADLAAGQGVSILVERPGPELVATLSAVESVTAVEAVGPARYRVAASRDVRAEVAAVAVSHGLLELKGDRGLEDVFLQLTAEA
jgi:ABC-2 type transport system ATP-binding protein